MAVNLMTNQLLESALAERSKNIEYFFARAPKDSAMEHLKTLLTQYLETIKEEQDGDTSCP